MSPPRVLGQRAPGVCSWCGEPVELVARRYDFSPELYWSVELCPCGELSAITAFDVRRHDMGRGHGRRPKAVSA